MIRVIFKDVYGGSNSVAVHGAEGLGRMSGNIGTFVDIIGDQLMDESSHVAAAKFSKYLSQMGYQVAMNSPDRALNTFVVDLGSGTISPSLEEEGTLEISGPTPRVSFYSWKQEMYPERQLEPARPARLLTEGEVGEAVPASPEGWGENGGNGEEIDWLRVEDLPVETEFEKEYQEMISDVPIQIEGYSRPAQLRGRETPLLPSGEGDDL